MRTLDNNVYYDKRMMKKKIIFASDARTGNPERLRAARALLAACVAIIVISILLFLAAPLLTHEKLITMTMDGRISITDHAEKYSRVLE
jgi:hypothetical protein